MNLPIYLRVTLDSDFLELQSSEFLHDHTPKCAYSMLFDCHWQLQFKTSPVKMDEARDCLGCGQVSHSTVGNTVMFQAIWNTTSFILALLLIAKNTWVSYLTSGNFYFPVKWG